MKKKKEKNKTVLWMYILPEIKYLFKAHCAKRGRTMTEIITDFMKDCIKEPIAK